jgi:hypothetical protein
MSRRFASQRSSTVGLALVFGAVAQLGLACGGEDSGGTAGGGAVSGKGGGNTGGSGGGVSTGGSGGTTLGECATDADCASGETCSATNQCIATGTCSVDADCDAGLMCDTATASCVPGGGCGAQEFTIEAVASNLYISLDRSCSMTGGGGGGKTKWQIAVDALNQMLTAFQGKIRWGLGLFPDVTGGQCTQDASQFPIGDNNETGIQTLLNAALAKADKYFPDGPCVTNIDTAVQQASLDPALGDKTRKSYVLLITDGAQSGCNAAGGNAGTTKIITDLNTAGVSTFVIGFGTGVNVTQLNNFANAGGVPANDPNDPNTKFYKANDQASLQKALGTIAGSIVGCTFALGSTPPDPSKLYVFFDNAGVTKDTTHQSGWDYDATSNQITFYGTECDQLKANQVQDVDVVFGCNQPTPN